MHDSKLSFSSIFDIRSLLFILAGVAFATLALQGFMVPNHFLDGGITGISILSHEVFNIPLSIPLIIFNLPLIYLAYRKFGKLLAIRSLIAITFLAICLTVIHLKPVTTDKLLIAVFGGFLIGMGMGLVIRGGAVIDGAEVVAVFMTKKIGFTVSEIIMFFNTAIFLTAAVNFGIESAMYSIITYFTATKTSDYIVDGIEEYIALTIISSQSERIKSVIVNDFKKGITVYKGERGYLPGSFEVRTDCDVIVTIVTRLEVLQLKESIYSVDSKAFMYVHSINEVKGGIIKQKSGH